MSSNSMPVLPTSPRKSHKKKLAAGCCLGCLAILIIFFVVAGFVGKKLFQDEAFKGVIAPRTALDLDTEREVSKTITAAGGVLTTQGADGTLYSLTVPPESVILPTQVTLTPLKSPAIENYKKASSGTGVYVGPTGKSGMTFIRPAFLIIKPGGSKPAVTRAGTAVWGRCNIGSRGFDPEICASDRGLPFNLGVEPGKVVVFSKPSNGERPAELLLTPTIPIGEEETFVAQISETGSYLGDRLNKKQLASFLTPTFDGPSDYINKTELVMHYAALGGDLEPLREEIVRMGNDKRDYPREVLKSGIVAVAIGETAAADKRIAAATSTLEKNLNRTRGSFLPWPRYFAFLKQIESTSSTTIDSAVPLIKKIDVINLKQNSLALAEKVIRDKNAFTVEKSDALELMAMSAYRTKPTPSPSPSLSPSPSASPSVGFGGPHASPGTSPGATSPSGSPISSPAGSPSPSVSPSPSPSPSSSPEPGSGYEGFAERCAIIVIEIPKCTTLECVERLWDLAKQYNCVGADDPAQNRMNDLLSKIKQCGDLVHKDLSNYGMNECEGGPDAASGNDADGDGLPDLAPLPGYEP